MMERRNGAVEAVAAGGSGGRGATACAAGMDSACNGIFFSCGWLLKKWVERAAVQESPREAGP